MDICEWHITVRHSAELHSWLHVRPATNCGTKTMFALASRSGLHQHTSIRSFACFSRRCSSSTLIVSSCMILCRKTCNCALKTRVEQQAHMQTRDGDVRGSLEVGSATCAWKSWKSCSCDWRSANSIALLVLTVTLRESQRRSGKSRCNAARRQGAAGTRKSQHDVRSDVVVSAPQSCGGVPQDGGHGLVIAVTSAGDGGDAPRRRDRVCGSLDPSSIPASRILDGGIPMPIARAARIVYCTPPLFGITD